MLKLLDQKIKQIIEKESFTGYRYTPAYIEMQRSIQDIP